MRILKRTNKDFHTMAREVGLNKDVDSLLKDEARRFLKYYGMYLVQGKDKQ